MLTVPVCKALYTLHEGDPKELTILIEQEKMEVQRFGRVAVTGAG